MIVPSILAASALTLAAAGFQQFVQPGTMKIGSGETRSAILHVGCSPDRDGGALSIELVATEANTRKDFDYEDFEGPDAPAGAKALSHIAWTTAAGTTDITVAAAGWYAPEPPQSFMFGVTQISHYRQDPAKLLVAISADPGRLVWTQTGFDDAKRQLVASFELDAAAVKRLHNAASSCLPLSMPTNPGK